MPANKIQITRRYNRIFIGLVLFILLLVVGTNLIIDPKNQLGLIKIEKLNAIKYFATGGRYEKSSRLAKGKFNTLIVGSSRAQIGIDPSHSALNDHKAYNAALSGTNIEEITGVIEYALQHQELKHLIFGLDFLLFTKNKSMSPDYENSLFAGSYAWLTPYLLSTSTFKRSIRTIKLNKKGGSRVHSDDNGFLDKTGADIDHRLRFQQVLSENLLVDPEYYAAYSYSLIDILRIEKSLGLTLENGIKCDLFISPVHARQLEAIRAMGLWDDYVQWKRDLVNLVRRLNTEHSTKISLWDFSGYNSITTEAVPPLNSGSNMHWYWESSHYKKSAGNLMLDKIMHRRNSATPSDFGIMLDKNNIQSHLNQTEIHRALYVMNHQEEVDDVARLIEKTASSRASRAKQSGVKALKIK